MYLVMDVGIISTHSSFHAAHLYGSCTQQHPKVLFFKMYSDNVFFMLRPVSLVCRQHMQEMSYGNRVEQLC